MSKKINIRQECLSENELKAWHAGEHSQEMIAHVSSCELCAAVVDLESKQLFSAQSIAQESEAIVLEKYNLRSGYYNWRLVSILSFGVILGALFLFNNPEDEQVTILDSPSDIQKPIIASKKNKAEPKPIEKKVEVQSIEITPAKSTNPNPIENVIDTAVLDVQADVEIAKEVKEDTIVEVQPDEPDNIEIQHQEANLDKEGKAEFVEKPQPIPIVVSSVKLTGLESTVKSTRDSDFPHFTGRGEGLTNYFRKEMKKIVVDELGRNRTVLVSVVVNGKGKIKDVELIGRGINESINTQVIEMIENMPDWNEGNKRGKTTFQMILTFEPQ